MPRRRIARSFESSSVALVDVTSNGVALVLVLITVSFANGLRLKSTGGNSDQDNAIVARRVASVVARDQLPILGDTKLHDYAACDEERAKDPTRKPALELHEDFVRITDTGVTVHRDALLQEHNAVDDFALAIKQRRDSGERNLQVRCAVHSIRQYYVALSILLEHDVGLPNDWHFMGERADKPKGAKDLPNEQPDTFAKSFVAETKPTGVRVTVQPGGLNG
jgi:hypothetical protein